MLTVELVTPQRRLFSTQADSITLPGALGDVGILSGHIPMVVALKPGTLILNKAGQKEIYAVGGGVAQIDGDKVSVLAETAEAAHEIDVERAQKALASAQKSMLEQSFYDETFAEAQASLGRAYTRITVGKT